MLFLVAQDIFRAEKREEFFFIAEANTSIALFMVWPQMNLF